MPAFPMRNSRQLWVRTHAPDAAPHSPRGSHKQAGVRDPGRPPSHPQGRAGPQGGECGSPGTSLPSPRPWRGNGGAEWRPAPARAALGVLTQRRPKPWGHPPPRNPALSAKPPAAAGRGGEAERADTRGWKSRRSPRPRGPSQPDGGRSALQMPAGQAPTPAPGARPWPLSPPPPAAAPRPWFPAAWDT